jgi:hypothetical protein
MRIFLILAGLMLPLVAAPQEIYRWVDKDGIVHYSDQPGSADAKLVTVIQPSTYESEDSGAVDSSGSPAYEPQETNYDSLAIVLPTPDQVFFGTDVTVEVVAELSGPLQSDHSVAFFVDGSRVPAAGLSVTLTGLPRGSHFVRATVLGSNGEPLISSQQIPFHLRQASIQNPQTPVPGRPQLPRPPTPAPTPAPAPNPNN